MSGAVVHKYFRPTMYTVIPNAKKSIMSFAAFHTMAGLGSNISFNEYNDTRIFEFVNKSRIFYNIPAVFVFSLIIIGFKAFH